MTSNNIKNKKNIHNCNNSKSLTTTVGFFSPLWEPLPGYEKGKYDCQDLFYLTSVQLLSKPVQNSLDVRGVVNRKNIPAIELLQFISDSTKSQCSYMYSPLLVVKKTK